MIETIHHHHPIKISLSQTHGWDAMNAYERAKLCCAELTRLGEAIPSWTTIRDIIGKGSSGDINRAKKDFRIEHAEALRRMEGFSHEGIPESVTPYIVGFWQEAVGHAKQSFAEQTRIWADEIEQANATAQLAESERDQALADAKTLQASVAGLEETRDTLQGQIQSEQAARGQAEKMATEARADLVDQRNRLDAALAEAKEELNKAITRLEGTEKRSLMEIERARQEAARQVADANARLKSEQDRYTLDTTRLNRQLQEARTHTSKVQERNTALEQENRSMRERIQSSEKAFDDLRHQNNELLSAVSQATATKRVSGRRSIKMKVISSRKLGRKPRASGDHRK